MPNTPISGPGRVPITLRVNGQSYNVTVIPNQSLAEVLRIDLGLTGTKVVCAMGDCGACTVWLDGVPVYSCLQLAIDCQGQAITTIEGLTREGKMHPVQAAFIADDAFQCGYCTSGQIMTLAAFLEKNAASIPDADSIKRAVSGNLCRCGAYPKIVKAGLRAAKEMSSKK
jgi:xanthine dehydrogenase YagT iron-sulfur-binding subunit